MCSMCFYYGSGYQALPPQRVAVARPRCCWREWAHTPRPGSTASTRPRPPFCPPLLVLGRPCGGARLPPTPVFPRDSRPCGGEISRVTEEAPGAAPSPAQPAPAIPVPQVAMLLQCFPVRRSADHWLLISCSKSHVLPPASFFVVIL